MGRCLDILLTRGFAALSVRGAARSGRGTITVAALRLLNSQYLPRGWKCWDIYLIFGMAGWPLFSRYGSGRCVSSHPDSKFSRRHRSWGLGPSSCNMRPMQLAVDSCKFYFRLRRHVFLRYGKEPPYIRSLVDVMRSAAVKRSFHDGL